MWQLREDDVIKSSDWCLCELIVNALIKQPFYLSKETEGIIGVHPFCELGGGLTLVTDGHNRRFKDK